LVVTAVFIRRHPTLEHVTIMAAASGTLYRVTEVVPSRAAVKEVTAALHAVRV